MYAFWFTVKRNPETGEVIDVPIGRITDTDTTETQKIGFVQKKLRMHWRFRITFRNRLSI